MTRRRCHGDWSMDRRGQWPPWCSRRCVRSVVRPALILLAAVSVCGAQDVQWPRDAAQRLGLSVTFNCSAGPNADVAWSKVDDDGQTSILFVNADSWNRNATRRMRAAAMTGGGFSLTLTSLERGDDAEYQCSIRQSGLSQTATLTVLGRCCSVVRHCWGSSHCCREVDRHLGQWCGRAWSARSK